MTVHTKYIGVFNDRKEETFFNVSRVKIQTLSTEAYGRLTRQAIKLEFSTINNDRSFPERDGGWLLAGTEIEVLGESCA